MERANEEHPEDRVVIDVAGPTEAQVRQFNTEHDHWMDLNSQTMELIYTMCEDKPREYIEDEEYAQNRWIKLETHYQSSGFTLRFTKYKEFIHTTMANSDNSIESYCTNLRSRARELKKMNASISEWLMVAVLLDNLGEKYSSFVHRIVASRDEVPEFDKVVTMLYEEDRLLKSDKHNKASGNGNGKGNGRGGSNSRGGRGGRGGRNNGNTNTNDRHSKNPNSTNYKGEGDPPECEKCPTNAKGNLKKHWPYDCWSLHEDRIPEKYRNNNKPKANKATEKDDFVDANSTHFSAMAMEELPKATSMAMSAIFMQGMEGDEEQWGWSINEAAPKMGSEEMTKQPNIQPLDQSLTAADQLEEISGNESNIEADLLIPRPNLACEASRGAHGVLTSQQMSPGSSPIFYHQAYVAKSELSRHRSPDWLIDSGSTNHMYHDKEEFTNYQSYHAGITIADGLTVWAKGHGTVQHEWIIDDGSTHIVDMKDVLHVPELTCGLFSLNQATRNGLGISFSGEDCHIYKGRKIIGSAPKVNNIYTLNVSQPTSKITMLIQENLRALATNVMYNEEAVELWHRRMGHLNEADLKRLVTMSNGIVLTQKPHVKALCEACQKAKSKRKVSRRI